MKRIEITVELDDTTKHELVIGNPSLVAWDRTRATRKWPTTEEAPILWMTFIAWHHMKARGLIKCEYPEFEEKRCLSVSDTVKPLSDAELLRLTDLEHSEDLTDDEREELEALKERHEESQADVDPTPLAPDLVSSSS